MSILGWIVVCCAVVWYVFAGWFARKIIAEDCQDDSLAIDNNLQTIAAFLWIISPVLIPVAVLRLIGQLLMSGIKRTQGGNR